MGDKMLCPGCGAYTSNVLADVEEGRPCRYCGLSADAIIEINDVRGKQADKELKDRLEAALIERDKAVTEAAELRHMVEECRRVLGCAYPYSPHHREAPATA